MVRVRNGIIATLLFSLLSLIVASPSFAQVNIRPDIIQDVNIPNLVRATINILFVIAAVIAIIFLVWGGIKWIMSGGDKAALESARSHIIAAIVGLVLVFLSFFIVTFVFDFLGLGLNDQFNIPNVTDPGL